MTYKKQNKLHILSAVAVIRRHDGRILLLKRSEDEVVYPGHFTFPGGKVEGSDTISETLIKEVREECGLELESGFVLLKEKSIVRPDGQTSKSLSFLCTVKDTSNVVIDERDFTQYKWTNLTELEAVKHVGIKAEFDKVEQMVKAGITPKNFFIDTDKVDLRAK